MKQRILVIKLGALGDLVLCSGAFAAIRAKHPDAEIALLTGPAFAAFGLQMPWFDKVLLDLRPRITQPLKWIELIRAVRGFAPTFVYDFQGKTRQTILYHSLGKPQWSGAVKGCSHPRPWPPVKGMHYTDFITAQLKAAGVGFVSSNATPSSHCEPCLGKARLSSPQVVDGDAGCEFGAGSPRPKEGARDDGFILHPDLSWLDGDIQTFNLPDTFALIITGCSPQHPHKMWPAAYYAQLADCLKSKGLSVVAIGTKADQPSVEAVRALAPHVIDLTGKTSLGQVAALARRAEIVVGNDTGPTHIAAAVGAKTIALMSEKVDPLWSCPRGPQATWLGGRRLADVSVEEVWGSAFGGGVISPDP